jgi:hypothetical protein
LDATVISSRDDLVAIVRKRQDELNISCETVDQLAGLADRHYSKLTSKVKGFGFLSTFVVLAALGLRLRVEEDPDAIARLRHRWTPRQFSRPNAPHGWRTPPLDTAESLERPALDGPVLQALDGVAGVDDAPVTHPAGLRGLIALANERRARSAALARAAANDESPDFPAA